MDPYGLVDPEIFAVRQREVRRMIADLPRLGPHKLAGDDLRARLLADLALKRQLRAAGLRPAGTRFGSIRYGLGSLLVRMGRRLQGMAGGDLGAQPGLHGNSPVR